MTNEDLLKKLRRKWLGRAICQKAAKLLDELIFDNCRLRKEMKRILRTEPARRKKASNVRDNAVLEAAAQDIHERGMKEAAIVVRRRKEKL